jgi:hypothetical protein
MIFFKFLSFVLLNSSLNLSKGFILLIFILLSDNSVKNLTKYSCEDKIF